MPQNVEKGILLLTLSANQNFAMAQFVLSGAYFMGTLIPQDVQKGINLIILDAEQDHLPALHNLGNIYRDGRGVAQDYWHIHTR